MLFKFDEPALMFPKELYFNGRDSAVLLAYKSYLMEVYKEFGANETTAATYAENSVNLEMDLANVSRLL